MVTGTLVGEAELVDCVGMARAIPYVTPRAVTAARIALTSLFLALVVGAFGCDKKPEPEPSTRVRDVPPPVEFKIEDLKVGTGAEAKENSKVKVHYTGTLLANGQKFDSSLDKGEPFEVELGEGNVIKGWDKGIPGMKVGGKRKLTIPHKLAYGEEGSPPSIPARAALVFEVELLEVN